MKKICVVCEQEYEDVTKRKVGKTCSDKCAKELGVKTRKEKGSYVMPQEQKNKISSTLKQKFSDGTYVMKMSEETIQKLRSKETNDKRIQKQKETYQKLYGVDHWSQTPEGRQKISEIHSGKTVSQEQLKKMSLASREKLKNQNIYSFSKKGIREDLNCFFRSSWEANYARYLNHIGESWQYESVTYELNESTSYTPDFILSNGIHVEIKGWLTQKAAEKISFFKKLHPDVTFVMIDKKKYNEIKELYQFVIKNWE